MAEGAGGDKPAMGREEALFWIFLTIFGTGLYLVFDHPFPGAVIMLFGIVGLAYSLRQHLHATSYKTWIVIIAMTVTAVTSGYDVYLRIYTNNADNSGKSQTTSSSLQSVHGADVVTPRTTTSPDYLNNVLFTLPPPSLWAKRGVVTLEADPAITSAKIRIFVEYRIFISGNPDFSNSGQWYPSYGRIPIADISNPVRGVHLRIPFICDSKRGIYEHVFAYGSSAGAATLPYTPNDPMVYPVIMRLIVIGDTPQEQDICASFIFNPSGKFKFLFVNVRKNDCVFGGN